MTSSALLVPDLYALRIGCCPKDTFCYSTGCCKKSTYGCEGKSCCEYGESCCSGGGCCKPGYVSKLSHTLGGFLISLGVGTIVLWSMANVGAARMAKLANAILPLLNATFQITIFALERNSAAVRPPSLQYPAHLI